MKIPYEILCIMLSIFPIQAEVSAPAPAPVPAPAPAPAPALAPAPVTESCNVMELVPCANAFTTGTLPSQECCERLKQQKRPCICQYMNDPTLEGFINTPNAKMVSDRCGSPMPNNC